MSSIDTKIFLKSSWLVAKYLPLGFAQEHSGLKFHSELVFPKFLSFEFLQSATGN